MLKASYFNGFKFKYYPIPTELIEKFLYIIERGLITKC